MHKKLYKKFRPFALHFDFLGYKDNRNRKGADLNDGNNDKRNERAFQWD